MSTSIGPVQLSALASSSRAPLRLRIAAQPGRDHLDGGWWPQSHGLAVELADLADHFPPRFGRIVRAIVSRADWDAAPRRVRVEGGSVRVAAFPREDAHVVHLTTMSRLVLRVLVIPPGLSLSQGEEALLAAATAGNAHSAAELLEEVTGAPDIDPFDHWGDDGGSWQHAAASLPVFRRGR